MKTHLFQTYNHCWDFQICWHIECSTFIALSFRIWNSSTRIPSPPPALFIVMLPKAHLTLNSKMSGSRWVIIPSWVSGLWRSFLYSSYVYSWHLFLISSASVRSIPFLSFIVLIFAWNVPLVALIFLKRSLVFLVLLFSSVFWHWSLRKAFLYLLAILWNSAFKWVYISFSPLFFASLLFTAICKASPDSPSPDSQYQNQINYILCSQRWRSSIQSAKTRPGADCGSDHELLISKFWLKLKK